MTDGSSALTTTWTYGQNGQPLTMVTPDGNAPGGTPANCTTQYGYDNSGDLTTVTSPPTRVQSYANQAGSTAQSVTTYAYDTFGDKTAARDPDLNVTTYAYANADGQVTSVTQPSYTQPSTGTTITPATTYAYDGDGNVTSVTDPRGNTASASYNALGEVTAVTSRDDQQRRQRVSRATARLAGRLVAFCDTIRKPLGLRRTMSASSVVCLAGSGGATEGAG